MLKLVVISLCILVTAQDNQRVITIDGGWSPWSTIATPCLRENKDGIPLPVSCGGGKMTRKRSCTNPVPQGHRPKSCEGAAEKSEDCNTNPCDMQWSSWSNCSATCGRGARQRFTLCAENTGSGLSSCKELGLDSQDFEHIEDCNTWDKVKCPSPCIGYKCMDFAACVDTSDNLDPNTACECQLGRIKNDIGDECIIPPPSTPSERPIPTLAPNIKVVTGIITRSASTILIVFVGVTIFLFGSLRIYDHARVIQMNMEIALILAHLIILAPNFYTGDPEEPIPMLCRIQSILIHLFFTATFMFMFLESLHTYSLVAYVVKKNGILSRLQNTLVGWGFSIAIVLMTVGLMYDDYGGSYHCWLQVNKPLVYGQVIVITVIVIFTFTIIEAAGAENYRRIPGLDQGQWLSAKIMQRTNLIITPLVFASFILGFLSEYNQDVALYSTFTAVNTFLGAAVFFFHCTGNERVREKLGALYSIVSKK